MSPLKFAHTTLTALALLISPAIADNKKVLFIEGGPSHGFGDHEHLGGSRILAQSINDANIGVEATVVTRWPDNMEAFKDVDSIVIYSDGAGGQPMIPHIDFLGELMDNGVGLVCIHFAVEVPKGEPGDALLNWIGGYFETYWSVNPFWTANFTELPNHPITNGVNPFEIHDEWYFHMRFPDNMENVTPILSAIPPDNLFREERSDRGGNPDIVKTKGTAHHVAWAIERPNGGRGFGFTGGHVHWNWGHDDYHRLVANAIVWTTGANIPESGIPIKPINVPDLLGAMDQPPPENFNPQTIQDKINSWNNRQTNLALPLLPLDDNAPITREQLHNNQLPPAAFRSDIVSPNTPGHAIDIEVNISNTRTLKLEVDDAGDGHGCDWANWINPRLIDSNGNETPLTDLEWTNAKSGHGNVHINANSAGNPMIVDNTPVPTGIGTHSNSEITYHLPENHDFVTFKSRGGLDQGGVVQGCGSTVRFAIHTSDNTADTPETEPAAPQEAANNSRNPEDAAKQLDIAAGLNAQLFASEPMITSPTNIDVDHRGRIWLADVQNYRGRAGTRPEGDRILILEDTTGDGTADKVTTFYQGNDIDSALGVTVLGNMVIVPCSPNVFIFYDDNGDDKADRKEILFSNTGTPQHDHSAHQFVFGPDGKFYWNFGDTGRHVHDAENNIIIDIFGNEVRDNGNPYRKGMAFRHNPDGSEFEVIGHNFRNPYGLTVDSYGRVWQSDNDDDGNRACRINLIMDYGNYGYSSEITGAGWREPRSGMHPEIPQQHWHTNDPGSVPNLINTGSGSPSEIIFYEGDLLPSPFQNTMIHAEPGHNVLRAYPFTTHGAGYTASIANLLKGSRDNWFRPIAASVAPDGSIFVADWYDPGVGGHGKGDDERGRVFRIAPPNHNYHTPELDLSTAEAAVNALKSPNQATRYLAWTTLHNMDRNAGPALRAMYEGDDPRFTARALWLLSKIDGYGPTILNDAIKHKNPDIRMTALRAARQIDVNILDYIETVQNDPSPGVRREALIALHGQNGDRAATLWATMATQHSYGDRWYVEALGIAAEGNWEACFNAWLERVGDQWNTWAGREIIWRSRAPKAASYLANIILDPTTPNSLRPRFIRSLDFLSGPEKDAALIKMLGAGL